MRREDFSHIRGIIWDLDGTLYRYTHDFKNACSVAAVQTAIGLGLEMAYEDALALAIDSEKIHGNSVRLFSEWGLPYKDCHDLFHRKITVEHIAREDDARAAVHALDLPMVLLTNASRDWADRMLAHLGLDDIFGKDRVLALEDAGFNVKSQSDRGFKMALDLLGLPAGDVVATEDLPANLITAKNMGLATALVHQETAPETLDAHIDRLFDDVISFADTLGLETGRRKTS